MYPGASRPPWRCNQSSSWRSRPPRSRRHLALGLGLANPIPNPNPNPNPNQAAYNTRSGGGLLLQLLHGSVVTVPLWLANPTPHPNPTPNTKPNPNHIKPQPPTPSRP